MDAKTDSYPRFHGQSLKDQRFIAGLSAPAGFAPRDPEVIVRDVVIGDQRRQIKIEIAKLAIRGTVYSDLFLIRVDTQSVERPQYGVDTHGRCVHRGCPLGESVQKTHEAVDALLTSRGLQVFDYYGSWPTMEMLVERKTTGDEAA